MFKANNKRERVCIITDKSRPIVATKDRIDEFKVEPLDSLKIVDTNSAGDAFCGGYSG
jgi:adenosine kinase